MNSRNIDEAMKLALSLIKEIDEFGEIDIVSSIIDDHNKSGLIEFKIDMIDFGKPQKDYFLKLLSVVKALKIDNIDGEHLMIRLEIVN